MTTYGFVVAFCALCGAAVLLMALGLWTGELWIGDQGLKLGIVAVFAACYGGALSVWRKVK